MRTRLLPALSFAALLTLACAPSRTPGEWRETHDATPVLLAQLGASDPSVAVGPDGAVALSWVTRDSIGTDAWVSVTRDSGVSWSEPVRVNDRRGKVSSYPESRPLTAWGSDGRLFAVWAAARDTGLYADDVVARASADHGATWGAVVPLNSDHTDPRSTYHGFATLAVRANGEVVVAWIDGRAAKAAGEEPARAEVRATRTRDGGTTWERDVRVAVEVCPCCRVALAAAGGTTVLAYRGARDDLRDPRLARSDDGFRTVTLDTLVSADRWRLSGCPAMGPAIVAGDEGGVFAWYTGESPDDSTLGARPAPGLYLTAFDANGAPTGTPATLGDGLDQAERPLLAAWSEGALVGALGRPAGEPDRRVVALRVRAADGALGPWTAFGDDVRSAALATGRPGRAWLVRTEGPREAPRVRVTRLTR
ncbi:MAG: sialidase family protein [bacterium]